MALRSMAIKTGAILFVLVATSVAGANLLPPPALPPLVAKAPTIARDAAARGPRVRDLPGKAAPENGGPAVHTPLLQAPDGRVLLSGSALIKSAGEPLLINLSGTIEANDAAVVDGELVFSGLDMAMWTEMLTSLTASYAGWDMDPTAEDHAATKVEIVTSQASERPVPVATRLAEVARVANRDFSAGVATAWLPIGVANLANAKLLMLDGKAYRSPAKRAGTFLIARPSRAGESGGIEQQISVLDGEQINFSILFSSPDRSAGDAVSLDLVRNGIELPLFMASGLQSQEPSWQSVSFTVPPGSAGVYRLRLTVAGQARVAARLPVVGFLVEAQARAIEYDRGGPGTMQ